MTVYEETDFLQLSGIQHFCFCRRQWALINIEQQWQDNLRTIEGEILHEKAHAGSVEKRFDILTARSVPVFSRSLGIHGVCDVVEFYRSPEGVSIYSHEGLWLPVPVEYKRGKVKEGLEDILQLCAQAMCLEEMLICSIPTGYLYYGEPRKRQLVTLDEPLRNEVKDMFLEMHEMYRRRYTPKVKPTTKCKACSLRDICLPGLNKTIPVHEYLERNLKTIY
jgi:CRISPR-associated exonuclease Cas4